ncbi:hypothetical protein LCGC14_0249320 [marine sediment metagenome]|uniref:Uncharacterized protein n=1 Tax=marine sediment metagenome TaxID=412755 RepID=A0A0F9U9R9_9ZZZZ
MPLPKPRSDENRAEFISRCISNPTVQQEFNTNEQRVAICATQFEESRERNMTPNELLLTKIKTRTQKRTEFSHGVLTADRWVKTLQEGVGLDLCYRFGSNRQTSFDDVLQKAAQTLTYSNEDMVLEEKAPRLPKGIEMPKNTLMVFRHILTTPRKDRDGDILRTEGAEVDLKMLLLWQHVPTLPIGKMLTIVKRNSKQLVLISAIVDINELSHDAAVMIDNGMGRFSHGFRALEFEELKEKEGEPSGFDVKRFEIMEESLVSVPSNADAETQEVLLSLVEGGKLTSCMMKEYGKSIREKRPVSIPVKLDLSVSINGKDINNESDESSSNATGGEEGRGIASPSEKANENSQTGGEETKQAKDSEVKAMVGTTGLADGHRHGARVDDDGNGKTGASNGHRHPIKKFVVQEVNGHKHPLSKGDLEERSFIDVDKILNNCKLTEKDREWFKASASQLWGSDWIEGEKGGRSLSKANEIKIKDAKEIVDEVVGMDISRPAKAALREASTSLATVLVGLGEETETSTKVEVKDAMVFVLAEASSEQRTKMIELLRLGKQIEKQDRRLEDFHRMLGR